MYNPEFEVLLQIARGFNNLSTIAPICSMEKENANSIIWHLKQEGLLEPLDPPQLSSKGLLELSKWLANLQSETYEYIYWSQDGLPFFPYCNGLKKDTVFYPNFFFKPATAYAEDEIDVVYATSLSEVDFSIENLTVLSNLLLEHDPLLPIGFWVLKCSRRAVCGWSVSNLEKTMQLIKNPVSMTFLCGFNEYVVIANALVCQGKFSKLRVRIFITRDTSAYLDILDYLREKLKPFMTFHNIPDFSKGREIALQKSEWWEKMPEPGLRITPNVQGKISYKDKKYEFAPIPLVVVLTPGDMKTKLSKLSPWFVTCPAGCVEKKLSARELHCMHSFQVLNLPEIDIVTFMINSLK